MDKALKPMQLDFSNVRLYAISGDITDANQFLKTVDDLIAGGIDALQLRSKSLNDRQRIDLALRLKEKCEKAEVLFIVNDRPDIALLSNADGVHLGHENMTVAMARQIVGHRAIIGASAHSLPQAIEAQKAGADYVSCGPLWATPTKPTYEPVGLKLIGLYKAALSIPFVAIGGIDFTNVDQVIQAGAPAIAIVRALFESQDAQQAAESFKKKFTK